MREANFGFEQVAVRIEGVQERVDSAAVSHVSQTRSVLECRDQQFPLRANLPRLSILNECVRYLTKGVLDRSFVLDQRDLLFGLGEPHIRPDSTAVEDWLRYLRNDSTTRCFESQGNPSG